MFYPSSIKNAVGNLIKVALSLLIMAFDTVDTFSYIDSSEL